MREPRGCPESAASRLGYSLSFCKARMRVGFVQQPRALLRYQTSPTHPLCHRHRHPFNPVDRSSYNRCLLGKGPLAPQGTGWTEGKWILIGA